MTNLAERAAAAAGRTPAADAEQPADGWPAATYGPAAGAEPEPDFSAFESDPEDAADVPAHVAWSRVMADVRSISKGEVYNASGTRYNFRGVDTTVKAFAPVLRRHGVLVLPTRVETNYRDYINANKRPQRECTCIVTWMVVGPKGDTLPTTLQSAGEALDSSDKGTAKAQSVALRVLLLTAAMVPTGDTDPDAQNIERGEAAPRSAEDYRDEFLNPKTPLTRFNQIRNELRSLGMLNAQVQNENGDQEALDSIGGRKYNERTGGAK